MILQAFVFAGGWVLVLALLSLAPRWVQRSVLTLAWAIICALLARAAMDGDSGLALAAIILGLLTLGLDAVLRDLRRARLMNATSGQAPGGAHAPGEVGKRDGERDAPSLPGTAATAGRAGRPRSFSEG